MGGGPGAPNGAGDGRDQVSKGPLCVSCKEAGDFFLLMVARGMPVKGFEQRSNPDHQETWKSVSPDRSPKGACLKAAPMQKVGRLIWGGLAMGLQDIGGEGPQSFGSLLEMSEGERLSRAAHDSPMR